MSETSAIVRTPDVLGGKPRIEGTRIGVHMIGESIRVGGQTTEEILDGYPDLTPAQVEQALGYYDEHPEEMAEIRGRKETVKQRLLEQSRAPGTDE